MKISLCPGPHEACVTFGRNLMKSSKVVTFSCLRVSPVKAWMVIGTSCMFSVRRCAVTTISWIPSDPSLTVSAPDASSAKAAGDPPKIDAIAQDNLDFVCICLSPDLEGSQRPSGFLKRSAGSLYRRSAVSYTVCDAPYTLKDRHFDNPPSARAKALPPPRDTGRLHIRRGPRRLLQPAGVRHCVTVGTAASDSGTRCVSWVRVIGALQCSSRNQI